MAISGCKEPLHVAWVPAIARHTGTVEGAGSAAWAAGAGMCTCSQHAKS